MNAQLISPNLDEEDKESISEVMIRIQNEIDGSDNDVQTVQDATKILFQKIDPREVENIAAAAAGPKPLLFLQYEQTPIHESLAKSQNRLKDGIIGYKYNFKNNKFRKLTIKLSKDS